MGKVKGNHRLDKYYRFAKKHGYRSRAACKLVQLDSKFTFLASSRSVLDLCAAPGGWMQVAVERAPVDSLVIGIDLHRIRPIRGAIAVQEDITSTKCKATVKRLMAEHSGSGQGAKLFDLILHDGSPNEASTSQSSLVIDAVRLASELLAPKGTFVTKVYRTSRDYRAVLDCLKQLFEKVEVDKPLASRFTSAEIYFIGLKYKAPAKIDLGHLDIKPLIKAIQKPNCRPCPFDHTGRRVSSAGDFIWSAAPIYILGSADAITFEDTASLAIKNHTLTTAKVRSICDDLLLVLMKQEFKYLMKWRMNVRKALTPAPKDTSASEIQVVLKENEDEKLLDSDESYEQYMTMLGESLNQRKRTRESYDNEPLKLCNSSRLCW